MPANVESMFYVREAPWHGLGICVESALSSEEALELSGLNWTVVQRPIMTSTYDLIPGYKANTRSSDHATLGIVTDRYQVVQNSEAFQFTDDLLGEGVTYETAGSLQSGRKVWLLARMPESAEEIRQLAYFLYTLCERRGNAADARYYNELMTSWHAIIGASMDAAAEKPEQMELL